MAVPSLNPGCYAALAEPTMADRLFMALDRRRSDSDSLGTILEVFGVHVGPDSEAWVQMGLAGEPAYGVVLHVPRRATLAAAVAALDAWIAAAPDRRPRVIRAGQAA